MAAETVSTDAIVAALRTRILTTVPPGGSQSVGALVPNIYQNRPPRGVLTYPFGVLRWYNVILDPQSHGERMTGTLELNLVTRPADDADIATLELAADLAQGAMLWLRLADSTNTGRGLILNVAGQRDTLPPPTDAVDEQTHQIRLTWGLVLWPRYLTRYSTP